MASWDMGYHADLLYTTGYYREISPVYLNYVLTSQGFDSPFTDKNIKACELGFGQGVSINLHAMSTPVHWYGTDFNPAQVNFAQNLAASAGLSKQEILLADDAFGDFLKRDDLPEFDYICLHGIWSWISPENQQYIIDFVKNKLKVGGVLYISYNTAPGFTTFEPLRHLMASFDKSMHGEQTAPQVKFQNIANFLNELIKTNPKYAAVVPGLQERINSTLKGDYHYLAGEYLNLYWDINHFDTMAGKLETAKLSFACSATISELIDSINLTSEQQKFLAPYKGTAIGENIRDFMVNQQFRRDLFIKGPLKLSAKEKTERLNNIYINLNVPKSEISYTFNTSLGQATLKKETFEPLYQLLGDYAPHRIGDIKTALQDKVNAAQVEEGIMTLLSIGFANVTRDPTLVSDKERQRCLQFNQKALSGHLNTKVEFLASPLVGGGCHVSTLNQTLLGIFNEHKQQGTTPNVQQIAEGIAHEIERTGQNLQLKGKEVKDHKQMVDALSEHVGKFNDEFIPIYKAMSLI